MTCAPPDTGAVERPTDAIQSMSPPYDFIQTEQRRLNGIEHHLSRWEGLPPTMLALHGFTGTGADFAPIARRVRYGLVAPDLIGHGRTEAPTALEPYRMRAVVERISALLPEAPVVLGYSMGARLALALALARPEAVRALVLISGTPGIEDAAEWAERAAIDDERARRVESLGVRRFLDGWMREPIIATQQRMDPALAAERAERQRTHTAVGLANSLRGMGTGAMASMWHRLDTLGCPVLLVTGDEDPKFTAIAERMQRLIPDARHVSIGEAGHAPHLERPQSTSGAIYAWLARRLR